MVQAGRQVAPQQVSSYSFQNAFFYLQVIFMKTLILIMLKCKFDVLENKDIVKLNKHLGGYQKLI